MYIVCSCKLDKSSYVQNTSIYKFEFYFLTLNAENKTITYFNQNTHMTFFKQKHISKQLWGIIQFVTNEKKIHL